MKPEAQRIAIAEACGWTLQEKTVIGVDGYPENEPCWKNKHGRARDLPDYLSDLNAMHEAEKVLTMGQKMTRNIWLWRITRDAWDETWELPNNNVISFLVEATAAQRAEAFLRTLNLWED